MMVITMLAMAFISANRTMTVALLASVPKTLDPVCGDDGIQYSNACFADCAGVTYTAGYCPGQAIGRVFDLGDPAVDGCGWVVELVLPMFLRCIAPTPWQRFMVDSLAVQVDYKQTMENSPCWLGQPIPVIEVLEMTEL